MIDLHTHTNFSDGSLSPEELIDLAIETGVTVLAITDHDEIGALPSADQYAENKEIKIVPGVELSIDYSLQAGAHLHLLGMFIDHHNQELQMVLKDLKAAREVRIYEMVDRINALGHNLKYAEIKTLVGHGSAGRPHLARLLIKRGIVKSVYEAFERYLSAGRPGHVPKKKLKIEPAINLIHSAGGLAVLAHPNSLRFDQYHKLGEEILKLQTKGLDGFEAYYYNHDRYFTQWLLEFAVKHGLCMSGGTDFHGSARPNIKLGKGYGAFSVHPSIYDKLHEFWTSKQKLPE
jgi:predicted metal-dependent phosphoesterase TrpH